MIPAGLSSDPHSRIRLFAAFVLLGLVAALAFHAIMQSIGREWPWTSFLFAPGDRYNDWHNSVTQAASGDPYYSHDTPALSAYFPGAYLFFGLAGGMGRGLSTMFYLVLSGLLLLAAVSCMHANGPIAGSRAHSGGGRERILLLLLTVLCSYPVFFALDRGNIDVWIACGCMVFVATQGSHLRWLGLAALALCIAAKGYPAAFLMLLVARREYGRLLVCLLMVAIVSLIALLSFHGDMSYNIAGLRLNLSLFHERYVLGRDSLFGSSDPYDAIRMLLTGVTSASPPDLETLKKVSAAVLTVYHPLVFIFALVCAVFVLTVPAPAWRRVTVLCLVAILFPDVANDYKLCCLFPGLILLLKSDDYGRREFVALVLFALLVVPKSYYFFNARPISMYLNPVLLLALAWQVLADRKGWRSAWSEWHLRAAWYLSRSPRREESPVRSLY